ncbi:hypothetical protein POTOM_054550 [Populus tomentosa]|uniref:Uncharacterized protein n=1 Tax=Populus tomentosa TaxID=118781 RepID=A0A8X7Y2Q0_POPTO|nr:hypothetical protein POTOM_054550 [Populus tomentosa]
MRLVGVCVNSEAVDKVVKEIMPGEKAEETRSRANSFGDMARKAVEDGGSSYDDSSPVDFTSDIGRRSVIHPSVLKMSHPPRILSWMANGIGSSLDALFLNRLNHGVLSIGGLCTPPLENGERLRDSIGDLLKFTLESHVKQTLEFNLGPSKEFCIDLLEEDPNEMSCHVTVQQRVMKNHSFDGVAQYPLYKRLALYHSVKCGALWRTHVKMMFCDEDSNLKYASFFKMLQAESLEKVLPGVKTVEEGSAKFGDGSTVKIQGRGSVLLEDFTGEHRILTNVYYIPMLKSNIISLGQLDENGCKVVIEGGVMTILDRLQRLLAKVKRSSNRLYVLNIASALPECFLGYRMFDPKTKQVVVTRDVVFDEEKKWDWTDSSATESKPAKDIFTVLYFPVAVSSDAAHQGIEEEMLYPNMVSPQPGFYQSGEPENTSAGSNRAYGFGSGNAQTPVSFPVEQMASKFIHPEA